MQQFRGNQPAGPRCTLQWPGQLFCCFRTTVWVSITATAIFEVKSIKRIMYFLKCVKWPNRYRNLYAANKCHGWRRLDGLHEIFETHILARANKASARRRLVHRFVVWRHEVHIYRSNRPAKRQWVHQLATQHKPMATKSVAAADAKSN